jgi:hypothetical protein
VAIAWTTIALLIFLLPGFVFSRGLLLPERFSRDTLPRSPFGQLAISVLVSFFVHSTLIWVLWRFKGVPHAPPLPDLWFAFGALQSGTIAAPNAKQLADNVSHYLPWIELYVAVTVGLGLLAGWAVAAAAVAGRNGKLRFLLEHAWVYDLLPAPENLVDLTYAYLLTKIDHDSTRLLYGGPLDRFGIRQDGSFAYFVLRKPERFCVDLEKAGDRSSERRPVVDAAAPAGGLDYFYVSGEEVANAYFVRRTISTGVDNAADLIKKIEKFEKEQVQDPEQEKPQ